MLGVKNGFEGFEPVVHVDHFPAVEVTFEEYAGVWVSPEALLSRFSWNGFAEFVRSEETRNYGGFC